jgi:hypothetical protein
MPVETFVDKSLTLGVENAAGVVRVVWSGKSNSREPERFLAPILQGALQMAGAGERKVVLDFTGLEYMNSSTFSPLVKMLGDAATGGHRVEVEFSQARKWQALSFSALKAFETADGRIVIRGK